LADMLVVMNAGRVEQIGAPLGVYEKPATTFVATFIGAPAMNLLTMSGAEPALLLRPELKVIFISGYPQEILDCNSPITRNAPILAKPFDLDTLQEHIQRLLA